MEAIGLVWKILLFSSGLWFLPSQMEEVIYQTKYGKVVGISQPVPNARDGPIKRINTFLGIPYARKPLGKLRFKPPQPIEQWKGNFHNASSFGNICVHPKGYLGFLRKSIKEVWPDFTDDNMSEDCLYLNIYAPAAEQRSAEQQTPKRRYPVLFYIHGGSYTLGTPNRNKTPGAVVPLYGVVLVTIHYRLGVLGYYTTGDSAAPGNYGMLDQIQALKWVKGNIASFGGDPDRITICGNSAGGSSVGLHLLSPLTKGLFHRAIIESGSEFSPFATLTVKKAVEKSMIVARKMLCDNKNHEEMVKCLQTKDAKDLVYYYPPFAGPCVDKYFLPDTPKNLRKAGKFERVPLMLGFTTHDGFHMYYELKLPTSLNRRLFRTAIERTIQKFLDTTDKLMAVRLADALELVYYPWETAADSHALQEAIIKMCTDYFITGPTMASANFHSQYSPTYVFEYRHLPNNSNFPWVSHSSNVEYAFGAPIFNQTRAEFSDEDREVSRFILEVYSNFIKHGNPTPQPVQRVNWTAYSPTKGAYMKVQYDPQLAHAYEPRRMALWNYYVPKMEQLSCAAEESTAKSQASSVVTDNARFPDVLVLIVIHLITRRLWN